MKEGDPILFVHGKYAGKTGRVMHWYEELRVLQVQLRNGTEYTTYDTDGMPAIDQFIQITEEEYAAEEVITE